MLLAGGVEMFEIEMGGGRGLHAAAVSFSETANLKLIMFPLLTVNYGLKQTFTN